MSLVTVMQKNFLGCVYSTPMVLSGTTKHANDLVAWHAHHLLPRSFGLLRLAKHVVLSSGMFWLGDACMVNCGPILIF
jgi:hypothetical protein